MAEAKLHIEGSKHRPEAIRNYLDFIDRRDYGSVEEVMDDVYRETGLDVNTKGMQTTLAKLGVVESTNRQQLTDDLGVPLLEVLLYKDQLFFEMLHLIYSTAYFRNPSPDTAISWAYYHISDEIRRRAPVELTTDMKQEIAEAVMTRSEEASDEALADPGPLSTGSLTNYKRFIDRLDPSVTDEDDESQIVLRSFVSTELVLAAIDHLYRTDIESGTRQYGDLVEITDEIVEILCTILLLQEEQLPDVIEHVASMDARLSIKSDYQLRVRLTDPVNIHDFA